MIILRGVYFSSPVELFYRNYYVAIFEYPDGWTLLIDDKGQAKTVEKPYDTMLENATQLLKPKE